MKEIECPYCSYTYTDDDMINSKHDLWDICRYEEIVEEDCVSCGRRFKINAGYIRLYIIEKIDDEGE